MKREAEAEWFFVLRVLCGEEAMTIFGKCPHCGGKLGLHRNPVPTVDVIIELDGRGVVLIRRKNPPHGWALPGGFVDYGESLEDAAIREAKEETSLDVTLLDQFRTYSDPKRDARQHTITTVYMGRAKGTPKAADDAAEIGIFREDNLPEEMAFDHREILRDYFISRRAT